MNIKEFKIGDVITRVEPALNGMLGYITEDQKFCGLDGEIIYIEHMEGYFVGKRIKLLYGDWCEGWQPVGVPKNPKGLKYSRRFNRRLRKIRTKK